MTLIKHRTKRQEKFNHLTRRNSYPCHEARQSKSSAPELPFLKPLCDVHDPRMCQDPCPGVECLYKFMTANATRPGIYLVCSTSNNEGSLAWRFLHRQLGREQESNSKTWNSICLHYKLYLTRKSLPRTYNKALSWQSLYTYLKKTLLKCCSCAI